jgi:hypothetical protein
MPVSGTGVSFARLSSEVERYGDYRTKRIVLEAYDELEPLRK